MEDEKLKRYLPEEVPDHLFTKKKLDRMGLVPDSDHVAYVLYPEQRREYRLYDITSTKTPNRRKLKPGAIRLTTHDKTLDEIIEERKNELEVRKEQLKGKY